MLILSTGRLAGLLRVPVHVVSYLTRDGQIRPVKGPTGAFVWTLQDALRVARLLQVAPPTEEAFKAAAEAVR